MKRRVVITSIGMVSSLGCTQDEVRRSFKERRVLFERPAFDEDVVVSSIRDFNIRDYTGSFKDSRYLNRGAQFSVASAFDAVKNSGCEQKLLSGAGLFVGAGPNLDIGGEFPRVAEGNIDRSDLQALWILRFLPNTAASVISRLTGIHGENLTVSTACSASLQAVGEAFRRIKNGYLDCALAGGGDSRLSHGGILAYKKAQALCSHTDDPEKASRPFDSGRSGFVPGEGGAFFLLEEFEAAKKRGANMYAEVCGYGCSLDAHSMTAPEKSGKSGKAAVCAALDEADISPSRIEVVSAHGTGTVLNDEREADMISDIFGEKQPHVIALKSWIGHTASACGALELAAVLACMQVKYLPEIRNLDEPCHRGIGFVRRGMNVSFNTAVIENFGFGGQNGALVVKKVC